MKKSWFRAICASAMLCAAAASALAQGFPSKPIRIIVAFGPGGGNELFARAVGEKMRERLGQPVLVEIKPGAAGNIAAEFVARSAPDGHTLLVAQSGLTMQPWLSKSLPFDVIRSFAPVGIGATVPMVVVVTNKLPVTSINELIAYARANPGKLSYATPGIGSPHHLAVELLMNMTQTRMVQVPYKGASAMLTDLISGEVHLMIGAINSAIPFFRAGKIRAIAVPERQRLPQFRDLPTVNESLPGYEVNIWFGLMVPAGTPDALVNLLSGEMRTIVNLPDVRESLTRAGLDSNPTTPAEMSRIMTSEIEKWGKVVKAAGIQPQ